MSTQLVDPPAALSRYGEPVFVVNDAGQLVTAERVVFPSSPGSTNEIGGWVEFHRNTVYETSLDGVRVERRMAGIPYELERAVLELLGVAEGVVLDDPAGTDVHELRRACERVQGYLDR